MKFKKKYTMDMQSADTTLQNVFSACKINAQAKSVRELQEKHEKEERGYHSLMFVAVAVLILVLLMPLCFHRSEQNVTRLGAQTTTVSVYQHHLKDGIFYLTFSGGDQIRYADIYLVDENGERSKPLSYDSQTSTITFAYQGGSVNIYIPDQSGNQLHLLLSPK